MQLTIKPYPTNKYPLRGILLKGAIPLVWAKEIQALGLSLSNIKVYPIPGTQANSLWGCLLILGTGQNVENPGKHERCQLMDELLFVPERTSVHPTLITGELAKLLGRKQHIFHPAFGLVELTEPFDWAGAMQAPEPQDLDVIRPSDGIDSPSQIKSFQVKPIPAEEVIAKFQGDFPKQKSLKDTPLTPAEKAKMLLYRQLLSKDGKGVGGNAGGALGGGLLKGFGSLMSGLGFGDQSERLARMAAELEALERRNQKEVDKLLNMLKDDPEQALKYAIPLDEKGTSRGGDSLGGGFTMSRRWGDFSLSGSQSGGGRGGVDLGDHYFELRKQYIKAAEDLIKQGDYKKAAFIYFKLLKNYTKTAQTLADGGFYQEAASIYLKYLKDKKNAAICYEKGNHTLEAIELYKELKEYEKVGDLYRKIGKAEVANLYYEKVVYSYKAKHQFLKAALICKDKMGSLEKAQKVLLEGWQSNRDAFNCLNNYFNNIEQEEELGKAIQEVYKRDVDQPKLKTFLKVIKLEYKKHQNLALDIREIAYEIIAGQIPTNPNIASELMAFNPKDNRLVKDVIWFKQQI